MTSSPQRRALDDRGSVVVEYAIALAICALGAVAALMVAGGLLLRLFLYQRALLLLPFP